MNPRVRAAWDMQVAEMREFAGLHDRYDGLVQDLSPSAVDAALARLGDGPKEPDAHDEAQLAAVEAGMRATYGLAQEHRRSPLAHIGNLDLACYDREYAPADERAEARRRHLAAWPDGIDAAIEAMDRVPAPVAAALLSGVKGLAAGVPESETAALTAHARLVEHVEGFAANGDPDASLGASTLAAVMGDPEALPVDLGRLAERADAERTRLRDLLADAVDRYRPGAKPTEVIEELLADHPTEPEEIYAEARAQIDEATAFTLARDLLPDLGGQCNVGPAPESRRWAMAMMSWAAPHEADAPSWYYVTPPDPSWPEQAREEWLSVFSRTTLPAITVHEVMPGHYAHGRMLRDVRGEIRNTLFSMSFVEGWAHYAEELFVEEGFRAEDPRFTIGVAIEALIRVTRLASALGLHTGTMTLEESVARFKEDAFQQGPAAEAEAHRAGYDPGYGRYTWGKLEILRTRDEAQARWGKRYSHRRFHEAMLAFGSPALGLLGNAIGGD
jgi:hypothetical protein